MDYLQRKKEATKSEFGRLNQWDETTGLSVEQLRRETANREISKATQKNKQLKKSIDNMGFENIKIFDVAEGEPVQELAPAKKAKCRNRQQRRLSHIAQQDVKALSDQNGTSSERVQKQVDGNSCQIHRGIATEYGMQELKLNHYSDMEGQPQFEVMKRFYTMSPQFADDYATGQYEKREKYLGWMTEGLLKQDITAECFTPDYLAEWGGTIYTIVMRFKAFRAVYDDPVNKPYFDNLPEVQKKLIQIRILDMAKLYEDALRLQCRSRGVRMDDGEYLSDDAQLAPTEDEKLAASSFKERIEQRNRLTREALVEGYEAEVQASNAELEELHAERKESIEHGEEQNLKGTGLTGFLVGYSPETLNEIRTLFAEEQQETYERNKPLLDLMEQEFFHVLDASTDYTRRNKALDDANYNISQGNYDTNVKKILGRMVVVEFERNGLKQDVFTNRLNALREAMKSVAKSREPDNPVVKAVLTEFREKLAAKTPALQKQIDEATAGWADMQLGELQDEDWKAHERYTGEQPLAGYLQYLSGFDKHMYTEQLDQKIGLDAKLRQHVEAGEIKPVMHFVQTSRGEIRGLNVSRMSGNMQILTVTGNMTAQQAEQTLVKLATGETGEGATAEKDQAVEQGLREYKNAIYSHLKRMETKYGKLLTQLHPEDVMRRINIHETAMDMQLMQDMVNLTDNNSTGLQLFDDTNAADVEYKALASYYFNALSALNVYVQQHQMYVEDGAQMLLEQMEKARELEGGVKEGPALKASQMPYYVQSIRGRYTPGEFGLRNEGYGRW